MIEIDSTEFAVNATLNNENMKKFLDWVRLVVYDGDEDGLLQLQEKELKVVSI